MDDYLREVRPIFAKLRAHQWTVYRPDEVCQWDLWETSVPVPVGHGQLRRAWVVVCCLCYSRVGDAVAPHPHVQFDTNDHSLDPNLVGRGVDVRASQRDIIAVASDTGELGARHEPCLAKNKTIAALEHARTLPERRGAPGGEGPLVEQRPLSVYDQSHEPQRRAHAPVPRDEDAGRRPRAGESGRARPTGGMEL